MKIKDRDPMYVGIDPSYTGFGLIVLDNNAEIIEKKLIKTSTKDSYEDRLLKLETEISFIANILSLKGLYIEGPSYHSQGRAIVEMGALNYMVRMFFYRKGIKYTVVPPTTLKKYVTGKGNSKKELMLLHIFKKWNMEFKSNDLADAYALARMALEENK